MKNFIEVMPRAKHYYRIVAIDVISTVLKRNDNPGEYTVVRFKDGSELEVEESMQTIVARIELASERT